MGVAGLGVLEAETQARPRIVTVQSPPTSKISTGQADASLVSALWLVSDAKSQSPFTVVIVMARSRLTPPCIGDHGFVVSGVRWFQRSGEPANFTPSILVG